MASKLGKKGKRGLSLGGAAAKAVASGRRSAEVDLKVEEDNYRRENAARLLSLDMIKERPSEDTRPVDPAHVEALIQSIKLMGLIQPIYLDRDFCLIAGAHRLTAFKKLREEDPQRWSKIPVVVDPDLDATTQPEQALLKEIAENEKRSNLTPAQVQSAAQRLISADPSFTRRPGRLKKGEKALTPFLAHTFGVSTRYVRALLNTQHSDQEGQSSPTSSTSQPKQIDPIKHKQKLLKKIDKQVSSWLTEPTVQADKKLFVQLEKLLKTVQKSSSIN
jgi:hypothetical protein